MTTRVLLCTALILLLAGVAGAEEIRPGVLRTPDERFENLPGYDFAPHYQEVQGYRIHYLDEGPADGEVVLLLHGEPTWSYLYRKMIPVLTAAGHRAIVPDLIGFGRSDKPVAMDVHTYKFHVDAITELVEALDLRQATFFGQDWGGLIGLRVVTENEGRFARVVIANTGLPIGTAAGPEALPEGSAFIQWKRMNQAMIDRGDIPTGTMVARSVGDPSLAAAYDAPFPEPRYKAGPLIMPQRVPVFVDDPANDANRRAWEVLRRWQKPFLTAFSDGDPISRGGEAIYQLTVPGAKGQAHTTIEGAGHFLQEQAGEELAQVIVKFMADNPVGTPTARVMADDIPVAHTPEGFWKTMPEPILAECDEPLAPGVTDMRGLWKAYAVELNGEPSQVGLDHVERIEQCGNRVIVISGGVIHDMRCDDTYENGVNDVAARRATPISVAARFEDGVHTLRPRGMPNVTVTRQIVNGELVWRYPPNRVTWMRRVDSE